MQGKDSVENRKKQSEYYDNYVKRQSSVGVNLRHQSVIKRMLANGLNADQKVLEIGCGIGTLSGLLGKILTSGSALCLDLSPKSIETASSKFFRRKNLIFINANVIEYDFGNFKFDHIVLPDVIEHIPLEHHARLFKKLSNVLSPRGLIHINIPNPEYLAWCHEFRPDLLQIIDQPIYIDELMLNIKPYGLHLHKLETYSIWIEDGDYQYIVLRNDGFQDFTRTISEKVTFLDKIKYKLNRGK